MTYTMIWVSMGAKKSHSHSTSNQEKCYLGISDICFSRLSGKCWALLCQVTHPSIQSHTPTMTMMDDQSITGRPCNVCMLPSHCCCFGSSLEQRRSLKESTELVSYSFLSVGFREKDTHILSWWFIFLYSLLCTFSLQLIYLRGIFSSSIAITIQLHPNFQVNDYNEYKTNIVFISLPHC